MLNEVYEILSEMYDEQSRKGFGKIVIGGQSGFIFINKAGALYKHAAIDHSIKRPGG